MCGIVGVVSGYSNGCSIDEFNAFERMLWIDTFRGTDSTGVFCVEKNGETTILKDVGMAPLLINKPEWQRFKTLASSNGLFLVGHNRAATRGAIAPENAHPFVADNKIVLVQNGTMYGSHQHIKDTEVDSEAIAHLIAQEKNVEQALSQIQASYSLVWYNLEESSLNLIRNTQRPLYIAHSQTQIFFASELETIQYVGTKYNFKLKHIKELEPHTLFKIRISNKKNAECKISYTPTKLKDPPTQSYKSYYHYFKNDDDVLPSNPTHSPLPSSKQTQKTDSNSLELTIFNSFVWPQCDNPKSPYILKNDEFNEVFKKYQDIFLDETKKTSLIFTINDYSKVNNHPECTSWYLTGHLNTPGLEKIAVYFRVMDQTEEEIVTLVTRPEPLVYIGEHGGIHPTKQSDKYILLVRAIQYRPISLNSSDIPS